jgi:hypothetical protein
MTSEEMESKCIALMKKLGVYHDHDKLIAWVKEYAVMTDSNSDELVVVKRSELKNRTDFDCVLCGKYDPFITYRKGSTVQPCHDCGYPIVVSDDSPVEPPKVCRDCAIARRNRKEESLNE